MTGYGRPIAFYISAHGFGHGVRCCDIIRAFKRLYPGWPIRIVSRLSESFFKTRLGAVLESFDQVRHAGFDVGMVQRDAILTDVEATLEQTLSLCANAQTLIDAELAFLKRQDIAAVVADIPAIPLAAAARAGIPAIAVSNFSWDWIYAPLAERDGRWAPVVEHFRDCYRQADLLLRLPFACDTSIFGRIEDLPLLASPGQARRQEMADHFAAAMDRPWVLWSFTSLQWEAEALEKINRLSGYELFAVEPFDWPKRGFHAVDPDIFSFSDVMASVDVVISKPGFGIVSDCIANAKPLIYADRADFPEYAVLVEAIRRNLRHLHIPSGRLYAGEVEDSLMRIASQPEPVERLKSGGAEIAARRIRSFVRD